MPKHSSMYFDFLDKVIRLNSTIMTSLCVQFEKGGCALLPEALRGEGEGECTTGLKEE